MRTFRRTRIVAASGVIACIASSGVLAQDDGAPGQADPQAIFRAPLLREGSAIIDAKARIERDPSRGWWLLKIDSHDSSDPARELVLLPCTRLSEMQRIVEASPNRRVQFQVSGRVFVYRKRNYVLPTYAPVLTGQQEQETVEVETADDGVREIAASPPVEQPPTEAPATEGKQESAEDIIRRLDQAAGPIVQSPVIPAPAPEPEATDVGSNSNALTDGNRIAISPDSLLAEETSIVNRRGKITRDSAGGWMFVFDADSTGLVDPPVRLLPCLLLERIEDYARRQGNNSPALLSGVAYLHEGRNYLLPTVFRIPQERRNISP